MLSISLHAFLAKIKRHGINWVRWVKQVGQQMVTLPTLTFYQGGNRFWRKGSWAGHFPWVAGLWRPGWWRLVDGPLCRTTVWPAGAEQRQPAERELGANTSTTHRGNNAGEDSVINLEIKQLHGSWCLLLRPKSLFDYSVVGSSPVFTPQKTGRCLPPRMMSGHMLCGEIYIQVFTDTWTYCVNINMAG